MARLLYPKPKERYERFRLNPYSPLAQDLFYCGCVNGQDTTMVPDLSPAQRHGYFDEGTSYPRVEWIPAISRWGFRLFGGGERLVVADSANKFDGVFRFAIAVWTHRASGGDYPKICNNGQWLGPIWYDYGVSANKRWLTVNGGAGYAEAVPPADYTLLAEVAQYDGSALSIWLNGVLGGQSSFSSPISSSAYPMVFGSLTSNKTSPWAGLMADPMLWLRALTESEIKALADPGNVDLRVVNGPPLLLPVRTYWPGLAVEEAADVITLPTMHLTV